MEINRDNYEMFFLLYTDNELDAAEQKAVEAFVDLHADLKEELNALLQTRLSANETFPFLHKENLYKTAEETSFIHTGNYEEYFVLYADGELNAEDRKTVEGFIEKHPQKQAELLLLQRVKIQPDHSIVFPGKASLYRTEKTTARVITFQWRRMVAAASIIAIGGWLWMNAGNITPQQAVEQPLAAKTPQPAEPEARQSKATPAPPITIKETTIEQPAIINKAEATAESPVAARSTLKAPAHSITTAPVLPANNIADNGESKIASTVDQAPALFDKTTKLVAHVPPVPETNGVVHNSTPVPEEVKPLILDQAAFHGKDNDVQHEAITKREEGIAYWDTNDTEKKSKGKFRGLLRRASRLVNHVTNPDIDDKQAIVRVASFEITRK
ncbi:hypothetical protein [Agriterribacter sp.]|uniref:hypothetical protein n=1 Tax=Agriterribacter sp. TaxID=2821509 RepID=UPI002CF40484|nr:hypothetical protein [Agriterribacter sp.]HRO44897.1 hypothetical protein [Agriterribacter sp.]HRQ15635.1 hypothetical protein [Agriterribacter sp.]